jgi:O-antigen/teichoic acid export membrane protein
MALPFGIATFLNTIYFRLDITMMGILLPHAEETGRCLFSFCGDQQAGVYAVAVRIMEVLIILPLYFMNSVLPSLSHSIAKKNHKQTQRRLVMSFLFLFIIALPATVGIFILAKPIVELITPENFGSDIALQILAIPLLFTFFTTFFNFVLIAFGQQKKILWINLGAVTLNFFLNIYMIPEYGFLGAAVASLISEGFILFFGLLFVLQIVRFSVRFRQWGSTVFATVCMGIFTFFVWRYWGAETGKKALAVVIPAAVVLYGVLLLVLRVVDPSLLRMIREKREETITEI